MEPITTESAAQKRLVNDKMREGLRTHDPREPIPFFCECESKDCYEPVWKTGPKYDEARRDANWRALARHASSASERQQRSGTVIGVSTSPGL